MRLSSLESFEVAHNYIKARKIFANRGFHGRVRLLNGGEGSGLSMRLIASTRFSIALVAFANAADASAANFKACPSLARFSRYWTPIASNRSPSIEMCSYGVLCS